MLGWLLCLCILRKGFLTPVPSIASWAPTYGGTVTWCCGENNKWMMRKPSNLNSIQNQCHIPIPLLNKCFYLVLYKIISWLIKDLFFFHFKVSKAYYIYVKYVLSQPLFYTFLSCSFLWQNNYVLAFLRMALLLGHQRAVSAFYRIRHPLRLLLLVFWPKHYKTQLQRSNYMKLIKKVNKTKANKVSNKKQANK